MRKCGGEGKGGVLRGRSAEAEREAGLLYVSSYCYICVLMLLYMCPHTAVPATISMGRRPVFQRKSRSFKQCPSLLTDIAYVSIRQHTSAYVRIRPHTSAYVRIRPHTSAYVSIRQHTSACVRIRQDTSANVSIRQHPSAYVSIRRGREAERRRRRRHCLSAYVSIRQLHCS